MIEVQDSAAGAVLPVRAQPGARRNSITGEQAGMLKVAVAQPPEKGRANQAIIELLAEVCHLKRSQISLLSGESSRQKRFLIRDISAAELQARLNQVLLGSSPP